MGPIVKVIVPKLLAFKIGQDIDLLPGKPILAVDSHTAIKKFQQVNILDVEFVDFSLSWII